MYKKYIFLKSSIFLSLIKLLLFTSIFLSLMGKHDFFYIREFRVFANIK